jgi:MFS family permease
MDSLKNYYSAVSCFSSNTKLYLAASFVRALSFSMVFVIFNLYLVEGGFQEGAIGTIISMFALAHGICALPSGVLSDRVGRKRCFMLGTVLIGIFSLAMALTLKHSLLIVSAFLVGVGQILFLSSHAPFLADSSGQRERTHLFSVAFSNSLVASMVGSAVGGWLPVVFRPMFAGPHNVDLLAYRTVLVTGSVLSLFALVPLLFIREKRDDPPEVGGRAAGETKLSVLASRFVVVRLLIGLGAGLVVPFFNLYFYRRFDCTSQQIGLYHSIAHGMMAVAALAGPILVERFGKLKTIVGIQCASLPFFIAMGLSRSLGLSVVSYWSRAALMNTAGPITSNFMMDLIPEERRATVNSASTMSGQLGRGAATLSGGWLIEARGYSTPFFITPILYGAASVFFYLVFRRGDKRRRS